MEDSWSWKIAVKCGGGCLCPTNAVGTDPHCSDSAFQALWQKFSKSFEGGAWKSQLTKNAQNARGRMERVGRMCPVCLANKRRWDAANLKKEGHERRWMAANPEKKSGPVSAPVIARNMRKIRINL